VSVMTDAIPITIPRIVRLERALLPVIDQSASLNISVIVIWIIY